MQVSLFDFDLPESCIAQSALEPRESARLLHVTSGGLTDRHVFDLVDLFSPDDLLVFNDTRVIPARLRGKRGETGIELLLLRPQPDGSWTAFAKPAKRLRPGDCIDIAPSFSLAVESKRDGGELVIRFDGDGTRFRALLEEYGEIPLPPYIERAKGPDANDVSRYQTAFAKHDGAIAAPTAGLHFSQDLLDRLAARNVPFAFVTLHVGAGTFLPVKAETTADHAMHSEWGEIDPATAERLNAHHERGGRIVAIGTTSLRLLETAAQGGRFVPFTGDTAIFITPGYRFRAVDRLVTNFHLPRSTLFMLVSAFCGRTRMLNAYRHAIDSGYRFYSYGDACLLERDDLAGALA